MPVASGNNINLHFLIFVSVIPMQSHTNSWNQSRSTVYTRKKKEALLLETCSRH